MLNTGSQNGGTGLSMSDTGDADSGRTGQGGNSLGTNPNDQPSNQDDGQVEQECHVIDSVRENLEGYTNRERENAKRAQEMYTMCIKPTVRNLKHLINGNFIKNCPVTIEDINTEKIYGPDIGTLKGKSVRR